MQKVVDIITIENSLFSAIKAENAELYGSLFGTIDPTDMDVNLLITCDTVARFLVNRYGDNWERIKTALYEEYEVTKPYNLTQTTTTEKTATNKNTGESKDTSGIVGFDSETATDSTVDSNTNSTTINETENSTVTVENVGNMGTINNASLINSELELRKISLQTLILNDIQSQITLDIY